MNLSYADHPEIWEVLAAFRAMTRQYQVPLGRSTVQYVPVCHDEEARSVPKVLLLLTWTWYWVVPHPGLVKEFQRN